MFTPKATKVLEIDKIQRSKTSVTYKHMTSSKIKSAHISPKYEENISGDHPADVYNNQVHQSMRLLENGGKQSE